MSSCPNFHLTSKRGCALCAVASCKEGAQEAGLQAAGKLVQLRRVRPPREGLRQLWRARPASRRSADRGQRPALVLGHDRLRGGSRP